MKKLILLLAILFATQPLIASASLYSYYSELGQRLPSISERSVLYSEIANDKYLGTANQNNALESYLRLQASGLGAVTPQPRLLGDNTWTGTNTFSATTTLASGLTYIGSTSTNTLVSGLDANSLHYHLSTSTLYTSSTVTSHTFTLPHSLGIAPRVLRGTLGYGDANYGSISSGIATINNGIITQSNILFAPKVGVEVSYLTPTAGEFLKGLNTPSSPATVTLVVTSVSASNIVFDVTVSGASKNMYLNLEISN